MRVFTLDEVKQARDKVLREMRSSVFVLPTDNMYVLACNAMISKPVARVREIKSRFTLPLTLLAPSVDWIKENCEVGDDAAAWLDRMPGPFTLVLPLKNKDMIDPAVLNGSETVNVRIPDHWVASLVNELGYPLAITTANFMGQQVVLTRDDLAREIEHQVDFFIDEGEKHGNPLKVMRFS